LWEPTPSKHDLDIAFLWLGQQECTYSIEEAIASGMGALKAKTIFFFNFYSDVSQ
jgi:hypothetical protein